MKYNFDEIVQRRGTGSFKWDFGEMLIKTGFAERFDSDTLPLFTADMDIAVPPQIVEAMHRAADQRIYGYTFPTDDYYAAITDWFQRRHQWEIDWRDIIYCPGTVHAIGVAIRAFTKPGDGVIIQRPVYFPFTEKIESNDRVVVNNQMLVDENGYYSLNLIEFEQLAKRPDVSMFILCNPHNPTGRIYSDEELEAMSEICYQNHVIIVADEIHGDLIRCDQSFHPIATLSNTTEHIVSCTAVNKTFNVAGLHASAIIITDQNRKHLFKKELGMSMPSPFTLNAVISAYNECEDWLEQLKEYFDGTIEWVMGFVREELPKVKCIRPEGTYIFWMDFRGYGITAEEIRKRIYMDANVILEGGTMYDPDQGSGFERICLSSPRPMIQEAFRRIEVAFRDL